MSIIICQLKDVNSILYQTVNFVIILFINGPLSFFYFDLFRITLIPNSTCKLQFFVLENPEFDCQN